MNTHVISIQVDAVGLNIRNSDSETGTYAPNIHTHFE